MRRRDRFDKPNRGESTGAARIALLAKNIRGALRLVGRAFGRRLFVGFAFGFGRGLGLFGDHGLVRLAFGGQALALLGLVLGQLGLEE